MLTQSCFVLCLGHRNLVLRVSCIDDQISCHGWWNKWCAGCGCVVLRGTYEHSQVTVRSTAQSAWDCCRVSLKLPEHFVQLIKGRFTCDFCEYFVLEIQLVEVYICRRAYLGEDFLEIICDCSSEFRDLHVQYVVSFLSLISYFDH